jgi:GT2 family glycosyltransferase
MMPLPVSVVIPTRDRPHLVAATVDSILAGGEVPAEIVVIDQSATAADLAIGGASPSGCRIRHVAVASRGLSRARNEGVRLAECDLIVFVDDDMLADPGWLRAIVEPLMADAALIVTGRVLPGPRESPGGFVPALVDGAAPAEFRGRLDRDVLAGGNMAIRRTTFDAVGGFDPRLGAGSLCPAAEDNDLGYRLLEAGYRIRYVPDALLYHRAWRPAGAYLSVRYAYGLGKGGYYAKHMKASTRHFLRRLGSDLRHRVVRACRRVLRPRLAAGEMVYFVGVLVGMSRWRFRRHDESGARRAGDSRVL